MALPLPAVSVNATFSTVEACPLLPSRKISPLVFTCISPLAAVCAAEASELFFCFWVIA